jgi:hypothetical protein
LPGRAEDKKMAYIIKPVTGGFEVFGTKSEKTFFRSQVFDICQTWIMDKKQAYKRNQKNAARRAENEILRDISGTSARAAREDMGL